MPTLTLPNPPPSPKWTLPVQNSDASSNLTLDPNGLALDGVLGITLTIPPGNGLIVYTDGLNYFTMRGMGGTFVNPLTTTGDIMYENALLAPTRLGIGSTGQVLTVVAGLPSWQTPSSGAAGVPIPATRRWAYGSTTSTVLTTGNSGTWVGDFAGGGGGSTSVSLPSGVSTFNQPFSSYFSSVNAQILGFRSTTFAAATGWCVTGSNMLFETKVALGAALTNTRVRIGVGAATDATWTGADSLTTTNYAAFRFSSSASDTNWQCQTGDGSAVTTVDSGIAVSLLTNYLLKIQFNDSVPNVVFSINGSVVATITTHLPSASKPLGFAILSINLTGTNHTVNVAWVYEEADN